MLTVIDKCIKLYYFPKDSERVEPEVHLPKDNATSTGTYTHVEEKPTAEKPDRAGSH